MSSIHFPIRSTNELLQWTADIPIADLVAARQRWGAKAVSLTILHRLGLCVPAGFSLSIDVWRLFQKTNSLTSLPIWNDVVEAISDLKHQTSPYEFSASSVAGTSQTEAPRFSVRSGAPGSLPGLLLTRLNVAPGPESIRKAIEAVFESWNAVPEGMLEQSGLSHDSGTAVIVQRMVITSLAGVVFTRDPAAPHSERMVIEIVAGCGDRLVSGGSTPHRIYFNRTTIFQGKLNDLSSATKTTCPMTSEWISPQTQEADNAPTIPDELLNQFVRTQLETLIRQALAIEQAFEMPVDIEFGWTGERLVYFQARPIPIVPDDLAKHDTTQQTYQSSSQESRQLDDETGFDRSRLIQELSESSFARSILNGNWLVRHGLGESLTNPTPLTFGIWERFMTASGGYGRLMRLLGFFPAETRSSQSCLSLFGGKIYANPIQLVTYYGAGFPLSYDKYELLVCPDRLTVPPAHLDLEQLDPWFLVRWPLVVARMLWAAWRQKQIATNVIARFRKSTQLALREFVRTEREREQEACPLSARELPELIAIWKRRHDRLMGELLPELMLPGILGAAAWRRFEERIRSVFRESVAEELIPELLSRIPDHSTTAILPHHANVASADSRSQSFGATFGHRGFDEFELASPRYSEESPPTFLKREPYANSASIPGEIGETLDVTGAGAIFDGILNARLPFRSDLSQFQTERTLWSRAYRLLSLRNLGQCEFLRGYQLLREVLLEIGRKSGMGDDVFFTTPNELESLPNQQVGASDLSARRASWRQNKQLNPPDVLTRETWELWLTTLASERDSSGPPILSGKRRVSGLGVSAGNGKGRAVLVLPEDFARLAESVATDTVIVTQRLPPGSIPLLARAAALITETGGMLSHVSILARVLRIPMIVLPNAMQLIQNHERITFNGQSGELVIGDDE